MQLHTVPMFRKVLFFRKKKLGYLLELRTYWLATVTNKSKRK